MLSQLLSSGFVSLLSCLTRVICVIRPVCDTRHLSLVFAPDDVYVGILSLSLVWAALLIGRACSIRTYLIRVIGRAYTRYVNHVPLSWVIDQAYIIHYCTVGLDDGSSMRHPCACARSVT